MNRLRLTVVLILLLFAAACQSAGDRVPTPETAVPTTTTVPTPTPAAPQATLQDANLPDGHPADRPLVIHFSQPMDTGHEQPLLISPQLDGRFTWRDDGTVLVFEPDAPLDSRRSYTIRIPRTLQTAAGQRFDAPPEWRLSVHSAPAAPAVRTLRPTSRLFTERRPTFTLTFSQGMDGDSVTDAVSITPELPFTAVWQDSTLQLTIDAPLAYGVGYEGVIDTTAVNQNGVPLAEPYRWTFRLQDLVRSVNAPTAGRLTAPLRVNFSTPIGPGDDLFALEPAISGQWEWNNARTSAEFTPADGRFPVDTTYTLTFTGSWTDAAGDPLTPPEPVAFTTPTAVLSNAPRGRVSPALPVEVTFDRPMDPDSVAAAFTIDPPLDGEFSWEEDTLIFRPASGYFAESTSYTVTIADSALAADGTAVLRRPYEWSFNTTALDTLTDFGMGLKVQVLDANGRRAVHFQAWNRASLRADFDLYRLTLDQFHALYAGNFDGDWYEPQPGDVDTDALTPAASWQTMTTTSEREWGNVQETMVPDDVPPGLYVLNLSAGKLNARLFLVISDSAVTAKIADDQLVVWVTDINGDVQANAPVQVRDENGRTILNGRTDSAGLFTAAVPDVYRQVVQSDNPPRWLVVAGSGDSLTLSGLGGPWSHSGYWGWGGSAAGPREVTLYTITDRPVYRPGHTVYFKTIVRRDDDALLSVPPENMAVTVRVRDSRDNLVQTLDLRTNDFGAAHGEFTVADGAALGRYQLEVEVNGEAYRQAFKVEEYRTPDYDVTVTADTAAAVTGDPIQLTIDTRYFFGQPVADADVQIAGYGLVPQYGQEGNDYIWHKPYSEAGSLMGDLQGRTDANGRFTTTLRVNNLDTYNPYGGFYDSSYGSNQRTATVGLEATVNDGSNQTVSGYVIVRLFSAAEGLTVDHGWQQEAARPFTLAATVTAIDDRPVSGRALTWELRRYNQRSYNYDDVALRGEITSGANGRAAAQITVDAPGFYQVRVSGRDGSGKEMRYHSYLYVTGDGHPDWYGSSDGGLRLNAEEETVAPGETAVFLVESIFGGPALLTVERGTVRRQQIVTLTPPLTRVELPIVDTDAPNVHVTVSAWEPQETTIGEHTWESIPDSRLASAGVNITVPPAGKRLTVVVTPDRDSYAPGDEAAFAVRVTNEQGDPVSAELSAALVDEAIFALSDELSGPIFDGFYFERDNLVRTYHSMAPRRYMGGGFGGGGGGGDAPAALRQDFQDTALWLPALRTDFNGEATFTVTLPDNLTTWRLTAKAFTTDTQVGETTATILTQQDVSLRPLLPRTLTAGDTADLSTLVRNDSDQPQTLAVALAVSGQPSAVSGQPAAPANDHSPFTINRSPLTISSPVTHTITVQPGEQRVVGWSLVGTQAGEALLRVTAVNANDGPGDAVQLPLTVQPLAIPDVRTEVGQFTDRLQTTVIMPPAAQEMSTVELRLSRSIAGSLLEGLEYLTGYPYGCVEQTMSRALPNAVVGRALNRLGVSVPALEDELPLQINASIQRLYGLQHDDGGWGWWYDDRTDPYQTAWVLFGLANTQAAGYEIDPNVIERAVTALQEMAPRTDPRTDAFALYSMALAGHGDLEATRALRAEETLDAFSRAALALALHELGDTAAARELVDALVDDAVTTENGRSYWRGSSGDGGYDQKVMASTTRTTALVLSALSQIRPGTEVETGAVRYLMAGRRQHGWGTTNETAFAIIGLTDHLLAASFSESAAPAAYTVTLNGQTFAEGALDRSQPSVTVTIPRSALQGGANELVVTQSGSPQLYYVVNGRAYLSAGVEEAAGDIEVTRTYLDPANNRPLESVQAGELVRVRVRVRMPQRGAYMIVEDRLPGGLEALNEGLNSSSHVAQLYESPRYFWQSYGYNQKEIRDERVTFFITEMEQSTHTFTYYARATVSGTFTAMPAEVYGMYEETLWGRSATETLVITP